MAALALLVALPARAAEVVSSNIVGYEKIGLEANAMDILAVQFQTVGGGEVSIQDITVDGQFSELGGDWIQWWDAEDGKYSKAFYWGESVDGVFDPADEDYENPLGPGWGDPDQYIVEATLKPGQAFWSKAVKGGKVVVSGEVVSDGTVTLGANAMDLVCNPFPVDTDIQDIVPGGQFSELGGDWIQWWDAEEGKYSKAFYWGESVDGVFDPADEDYENPLGPGWGDPDQYIIEATIKAGQGFWSKAVKGGTLTFKNPVTE